ncbi:MAG: FAD binding domain-containing protein [Anaerolineae bacterium]|nr:FAD binding domain-containing protein [Anaerolineae bacterium]
MPNPSTYYRPTTVEEVVRLLSQPHIESAILSGGALRLATLDPAFEAVIDVQAIAGLNRIGPSESGGLSLGGAATLEAVAAHRATPLLLKDAITRTLTWNRRNAISVGEAIEYPGDMPEVVAALLALDAEVVFALRGVTRIPLADLEIVVEEPKLPQHGLITAVELPADRAGFAWGAAHVARTPADGPIVSAAAALLVDEEGLITVARLALSGVWPRPAGLAYHAAAALVGAPLDDDRIAAALAVLADEIAPLVDYRGSVDYRRAMAAVLARRALTQCQQLLSGRGA